MQDTPALSGVIAEFLRLLDAAADPAQSVLFRAGKTFSPDSARRAFWTHVMMNALLRIGKQRGFTTYPSNYYLTVDRRGQYHNCRYDTKTDESEFMLDVVWGTWGAGRRWWRDSRDNGVRMGIELACESEWGWLEGKDHDHHLDTTFNDFSKLVAIKSPLKVFIANSDSPQMTAELLECTEAMARQALHPTSEEYAVLVWDASASWQKHRAQPTIHTFAVA